MVKSAIVLGLGESSKCELVYEVFSSKGGGEGGPKK